jgi:hypothetical protein
LEVEKHNMTPDDGVKLLFTGLMGPEGVKKGTEAYLIELGLLVLAWNDMHEKLAELYCVVTGSSDQKAPLKKWHNLRNNSAQRSFLRKSLATDLQKRADDKGTDGLEWLKRIKKNVAWLVDEVDKLADDRNNFIHAPFMFSVADDGTLTMEPLSLLGNLRAAALSGKNLLDELRRHRDNMAILGTHSLAIKCDINGSGPAPTRPQLKTAT